MQKGKVLSLRRFGIGDFFKKNSFIIFLAFCFVIGVLFGTVWFDNIAVLNDYPKAFVEDYMNERVDKPFLSILFSSAADFWAMLFLVFMLGAGVFGVATVPLIVIIKGFFQGGITAYLYSQFALKGIAFNAVVYIPSTIIFLIVWLNASRESIRFSLKLSSLTLNRTMPFSMSDDFKDYCLKYVIFSVAVFFSALVDVLLSSSVLRYFEF